MASAKYGAFITELKGKVQGTVFQAGNTNKIIRNNGYRKGTASISRQRANLNLASITTGWRGLSSVQQQSWKDNTASWPFFNRFGEGYTGNGYQVYVAFNTALRTINGGFEDTFTAPITPTDMGALNASWDLSGDLVVSFDNPGSTNDYLQVFCSPPLNPGRNSNNVPNKLLASLNANGQDIFSLTSYYDAVYARPLAGQNLLITTQLRNSDFPYAYFRQQFLFTVTS